MVWPSFWEMYRPTCSEPRSQKQTNKKADNFELKIIIDIKKYNGYILKLGNGYSSNL